MSTITAVDLFCGVGGLTHGLQRAGIDVVAGIDFDDSCEYAYATNNRGIFIHADISELKGADLEALFPKDGMRLLAGCAPCQPFSQLTKKNKKKNDERNSLLRHFGRLVADLRPEFVTMENVPNVRYDPVFDFFIDTLNENGYLVSHQVVNCADYGIPQRRKRFVLLASRIGEIKLVPPDQEKCSLRMAIGNLDPIASGESSPNDFLHRARTLSEINLRRIRASKPGGSWEDWDDDLKLACHKRKQGQSFKSVYGRLTWDEPSSTITTQFYNWGTGRYGHPDQDRALSLREGATIQSFPLTYQFAPTAEDVSFSTIGRQVGNAVPVKLAEAIGRSIVEAAS
ncbi:MAG: DNA cytosine methyltransferase [Betaproteobacteria bacterium]|nr:DNA cytosine methyltransferase [Betaproteobacteria bacterium]